MCTSACSPYAVCTKLLRMNNQFRTGRADIAEANKQLRTGAPVSVRCLVEPHPQDLAQGEEKVPLGHPESTQTANTHYQSRSHKAIPFGFGHTEMTRPTQVGRCRMMSEDV